MVKSFLDHLCYEKRLSPHTIKAYKKDLLSLQNYTKKNLVTCTREDIQQFVLTLIKKQYAHTTVNRKITAIKCCYIYFTKKKYLPHNPAHSIKKIPVPQRLPQFLNKKNIHQCLDAIKNDTQVSIQEKVILFLLYHTGIRLDELIHLKIENIDLYRRNIKVQGKGRKERLIPFEEELYQLLHFFLSKKTSHKDYLIATKKGAKAYPMMIYRIVQKYLSSIHLKQKSPHVLRHTYATHLLQNGAPLYAIKNLLGHKTLAATQVYAHHSIEYLKNIFDQKHARA